MGVCFLWGSILMGFSFSLKRSAIGAMFMLTATSGFLSSAHAASEESFTLFESGQVRPIAMSNSGKSLFAVNTPDNTLEIFAITDSGLQHTCKRIRKIEN